MTQQQAGFPRPLAGGDGFSGRLKAEAAPVWRSILAHPMVQGIGDGSLDPEPFRHWVEQDYVYLVDYARTFAILAARAPDLAGMGRFARLLSETVETEMEMHRDYAERLGIPRDALERTEASPTTRGYTDFLVRTAAMGTFAETVAAILPCMWGFNDTGIHLKENGPPAHEAYRAWIEMYASEDFTALTTSCIELMDACAQDIGAGEKASCRDAFVTSARYELLFWDAAWRQETWPV